MKINRFIALTAIALLVVGAMGAVATYSLAKGNPTQVAQTQSCGQQGNDTAEGQDART